MRWQKWVRWQKWKKYGILKFVEERAEIISMGENGIIEETREVIEVAEMVKEVSNEESGRFVKEGKKNRHYD